MLHFLGTIISMLFTGAITWVITKFILIVLGVALGIWAIIKIVEKIADSIRGES